MSLWLPYGLLGVVAGPVVTVLASPMARRESLSWSLVSENEWLPMLAASALLSVTLAEVAERRPGSAGAVSWLVIVGLLLTLIDWTEHLLPHRTVGALLAGGLVQFALIGLGQGDPGPLLRAGVAAMVVFVAAMTLYWRSSELGFGDVTLSTTMAFYLGWFGWRHVIAGLVVALMVAAVTSFVLLAGRRVRREQPTALGPALIFAPVCTILQI